jgi:heme exporter protein A
LFSPVDFNLSDGEALQIRGTNGSGKTSMIRCLCGLSQRYEGEISFNQVDINRSKKVFHSNTIYLGHKLGLKPKLTVAQNLAFYAGLRDENYDDQQFNAKMNDALNQLSISAYVDEPVGNLSAGQMRRVSLARLITESVKFWILDEPMVALDTFGQSWMEMACNQHLSNGGMLLVTSHQAIERIEHLNQLILKSAKSAFESFEGTRL